MGTTDEIDEVRELAWDLLMRSADIVGCMVDPMASATLLDACEYFTEICWLEKKDRRNYKNIRHKTVKEPEGENGDGI